MVIWRGLGILIPVVAVIGMFAGGPVNTALEKYLGFYYGFGVRFLVAAVLVLLVGKGFSDHTKKRGEKHSFWFLPAGFWGLALAAVGVLAIYADSDQVSDLGENRGTAAADQLAGPANAALEKAEKLILSDRQGTAHGNTDLAKQSAELFSASAKTLREAGIEQTESSPLSLSGGEMLTYCHHSKHGMAFLVHVPQLRKFNDEAKSFMMKAAWLSAERAALEVDPPPENLYVAIRGLMLYDRGWSGAPGAESDEEAFEGVRVRIDEDRFVTKMLLKYFRAAAKAEDSTNVEIASAADSPATGSPATGEAENAPPGSAISPPPESSQAAKVDRPVSLPGPQREWKSTDGGNFVGALQGFLDQEFVRAEFIDADGKSYKVPIERFSEADQKLLRKYFDAQKTSTR